jgi:hypothetical protein
LNPIAVPLAISPTAGATPTPPATLNALLIQAVAAVVPGYTVLPAGLIEDLTSTGTGILATIDQARVDSVNNITPVSMSPYWLAQYGQMLGLPQGQPTNTSVLVVFSGSVGYVVPAGFIVSDGTYQYVLQAPGTVIGSNGSSTAVNCIANQSGSWTPAANTVTQIVSSVPAGYTLTCNNPNAGTAGGAAESVQSYRSRLMGAMTVTAQGYAQFLTTLLQAIPGVIPRLVSIPAVTNGWKVICGGGDPYVVAGTIYLGTLDLSTLQGSSTNAYNVLVNIVSPPNVYPIVYVNPAAATTTVTVTWNTNIPNFGSQQSVQTLAAPALVNYINSIPVGNPLNLLEMNAVFSQAVAPVLPSANITTLSYTVLVNGTQVSPGAGTQLIASGDDQYFLAASNAVTVTQG